jgi:hypothetical protein
MRLKLLFVIGLISGYVFGARAGRKRYDLLRERAAEAWEDPRVQKAVADAEEFVKENAPIVADKLADGAKVAGERIAESAHVAGERLTETAHVTAETAKEVTDKLTDTAREVAERLAETAKDLGEKLSDSAKGAGTSPSEGTRAAVASARDAVARAKDAVAGARGQVTDLVGKDVTDRLAGSASALAGRLGGLVGGSAIPVGTGAADPTAPDTVISDTIEDDGEVVLVDDADFPSFDESAGLDEPGDLEEDVVIEEQPFVEDQVSLEEPGFEIVIDGTSVGEDALTEHATGDDSDGRHRA